MRGIKFLQTNPVLGRLTHLSSIMDLELVSKYAPSTIRAICHL